LKESRLSKADQDFNTEASKDEIFTWKLKLGKSHREEREFTIVKKLQ